MVSGGPHGVKGSMGLCRGGGSIEFTSIDFSYTTNQLLPCRNFGALGDINYTMPSAPGADIYVDLGTNYAPPGEVLVAARLGMKANRLAVEAAYSTFGIENVGCE